MRVDGVEITAERWTLHDLDFLELSVVADLGDAPTTQAALTRFVGDLGLAVDESGASTTQQALRRLVQLAGDRPSGRPVQEA